MGQTSIHRNSGSCTLNYLGWRTKLRSCFLRNRRYSFVAAYNSKSYPSPVYIVMGKFHGSNICGWNNVGFPLNDAKFEPSL